MNNADTISILAFVGLFLTHSLSIFNIFSFFSPMSLITWLVDMTAIVMLLYVYIKSKVDQNPTATKVIDVISTARS